MWTRKGWLGVALAALAALAGALLLGCAGTEGSPEDRRVAAAGERVTAREPAPPATVADLFPEGDGRSAVLTTCGACHAVACSVIGQRTPARWDSLKESHREHVPNLPPDEIDTIFGYLAQHFNDSRPQPVVPPHFLEGGCTPF